MEIRKFAERCLLSTSIEEKLSPCEDPITDQDPGPPLRIELPGRPPELLLAENGPAMPRPRALVHAHKRAVAHHIMANHELQAVEVMALTLCAFPKAPPEFRRGVVRILADEQRHTRMHMERAKALGLKFGDVAVNGYIWKKALLFGNILDYVAGLSLTFEGRNLDHTLDFERAFQAAGDEKGAAVLRTIHRDEINHVAFGWQWLTKLKGENESEWQAFAAHLHWPLRPKKARGDTFYREPRLKAGMSAEFVDQLEEIAE